MTIKILHISLTQQGYDSASIRYFWDNPNNCEEHRLDLLTIKALINRAETEYYTRIPVDSATIGQALYNWLDQSDRVLANALQKPNPEGLIIAISTDKGLAHFPWELLHDGKCFLVEKRPSITPIRWMSNSKPIEINNSLQNRPLNVLFMATSPMGVKPILDYEAEEGQILAATQRTPINLRVEESGWLEELGYIVGEYESSYFDVFHLTGHASHQDGKPCFLTEDEYGACVYSHAEDIVDALKFPLPSLIFLSGCRTGHSSHGAVPSMAEELLNMGATTVLGWGEKVLDTDASAASSQFYGELSKGRTITQALSSTYQALIHQQARDWHKLRFYVATTLPQALVTPSKTRGRKQLPKPTTNIEFRDDEKRLRVAKRKEFVGRRRQLQNCLRTLKNDYDKVGVLIHGMGGWGKSSIASRLWDRLPEHEKVLWWRQIDEPFLIRKFKDKVIKPQTRELITNLEDHQLELKSRLAYLFNQLAELGEKPFLLIFDDFEWNLEPREGRYILKPEVASILAALVEVIQETGTESRIIITCRYEFDSELLEFFFSQGLEPLRDAELAKKLNRLEYFSSDKIPENLKERALNLANGNPRLLEFLNNEILGKKNLEAELTKLEKKPELWKYKIIWEELYQLIDKPLKKILSHCLVYNIRVPMATLEAYCDELHDYQQQLQRSVDLGLIEVSSDPKESEQVYYVSRILSYIIPTIRLPESPEVYSLYRKAHKKLDELWRYKININEEKWREIFRLLFADQENLNRYRQGFSKMLACQYNPVIDRILMSELRKIKIKLSEEILYRQLEEYLRKGDWTNADMETAWLFYLIMIQQGYENMGHLCLNFPSKILNQIDRLWVNYSSGQYGFSVQKQMWERLANYPKIDGNLWAFQSCVFYVSNSSNEKNTSPFSNVTESNFPALYATHSSAIRLGNNNFGWNVERLEGRVWFKTFLLSHPDLT